MSKKISLEEATMKALLGELEPEEKDDVEGIVDGVMVITDPDVTPKEYEEVIERAQEIIEDTPEGEVPFTDEYIGEYIMTCPICGSNFIRKEILNVGDSCPICDQVPEAGFVLVGQIATQEDVELQNDIKDDKEKENTEDTDVNDDLYGEEIPLEEPIEGEEDEEQLVASEQQKTANNKLEESEEMKVEHKIAVKSRRKQETIAVQEMTYIDSFDDLKKYCWGQSAESTLRVIEDNDKEEELMNYLEAMERDDSNPFVGSELNDLIAYDDFLLSDLGFDTHLNLIENKEIKTEANLFGIAEDMYNRTHEDKWHTLSDDEKASYYNRNYKRIKKQVDSIDNKDSGELNESKKSLCEVIDSDEYVRRMKVELPEINTESVVNWCRKQLRKGYSEQKLTQLEIARDTILNELNESKNIIKRPNQLKESKVKGMEDWKTDISTDFQIGDLVTNEVVWNLRDSVPPVTNWENVFQAGEPYSHNANGATYLTFTRVDKDTWRYEGPKNKIRNYGGVKEMKTESDRYQLRKFTNDYDEYTNQWGVYDCKKDKFIMKGSKKVMNAAVNDYNKEMKTESIDKDYDEMLELIYKDYKNQGMSKEFWSDLLNYIDDFDSIDRWYEASYPEDGDSWNDLEESKE